MAAATLEAQAPAMPGTLPLFSLEELEPSGRVAADTPAGQPGDRDAVTDVVPQLRGAGSDEVEEPRPKEARPSLESLVLSALSAGVAGACAVCGGATDLLADGALACGECGSILERMEQSENEEGARGGVWSG